MEFDVKIVLLVTDIDETAVSKARNSSIDTTCLSSYVVYHPISNFSTGAIQVISERMSYPPHIAMSYSLYSAYYDTHIHQEIITFYRIS